MAEHFRYIVIGGGMMGAAAARHLSEHADGIALIGQGEPPDYHTHQGVFASHYDEARITRRFDADPLWASFAARSIERYGDIETRSGIRFYTEAGCLFAGPEPQSDADYLRRAADVAKATGLAVERLGAPKLASRFPQFAFPLHLFGYYEDTDAGHINPRALVRAQKAIAAEQGTRCIDAVVTAVREEGRQVQVDTADGVVYQAQRVLIATGAFSNFHNLLPRPLDFRAAPRTVVFFELDEARLERFGTMPSTIVFTEREEDHVYILPPLRYPDSKVYLKLGGDIESGSLGSLDDVRTWFRSSGDPAEARRLTETALQLMPELSGCRTTSAPCVATFTPTAHPYAGFLPSSKVAVLTGGNFVAAKSSDELGRLGALLMREGGLGEADFGSAMTPIFQ
ncbi:sarcosine oxidase [Pseudorhizobium tarimense]|uniref:Sarcosine oxidase n=1 Tax=Pseudorhizobium tarimense TaxID=1079109 RepID=A0ABV2H3M2_9HYPH|nr:FAD-dependent oxidoreductase [Pseudorhizobium tarimense]MCJ8518429.1 FAD-dependent oxidoreductase [Pseudorhizobium tarimense]